MIEMGGGKRFIATKLYIFLAWPRMECLQSYMAIDSSQTYVWLWIIKIHPSLNAT